MTSVIVSETINEVTVVDENTLIIQTIGVGPQGPTVNDAPRSITIAGPQANDSFTLFRTNQQSIIASVIALVSNGSVTYELRYAADRSTAGTLATISDTVTNTTTGDAATVQNQPIPVDNYVWVEITAVSGTVDEFNLSVAF